MLFLLGQPELIKTETGSESGVLLYQIPKNVDAVLARGDE